MKFEFSRLSGSQRAMLFAGVAGIGIINPVQAMAQDAEDAQVEFAEAAPPPPADGTGDEIIVTATKREQTLQEVPVAVSVTSAETIERAEIRDLKDLQTVIPSLKVTTLQSPTNTNFIIRGFGNGANNVGVEPSVGVFVDGVYRSRTASQLSDLPDVQRIEVLRGPQSTLFGKNASAGVISIVTKKPSYNFTGSAEGSVGNYDALVLKGYVSGGLADNVAGSIAAGINKRDGYVEDANTGNTTNDRNRWFVRGQLLVEPMDDLSIRFIADHDEIDENCCAVVNLLSSPATAAILGVGGQVTDPAHPFADVVYNNIDSENSIKNSGISAQVDYRVGPATLTSITNYRKTHSISRQDADFTSADIINPFLLDMKLNSFTQEFRASAQLLDMFSVLVGAFYINEKVDQTGGVLYGQDIRPYADLQIQAASSGALSIPMLEQTFGALEGDPAKYTGQFFAAGTGLDENYGLKSEAISFYGQVDVEVLSGLTLTLGGNYTKDNKSFSTDTISNDVFAGIDLDAAAYAPFRYQLLYQGGLAQQVGGILDLGRPATAAEIGAFAQGNPAAYQQVSAGVDAYATANANNPEANPLGGLRDLQFLPPYLNVPNAVEDGKTDDGNFSYTIRLAYDVSPDLNLYVSHATGFKASSINLSRDSRPLASDSAALANAGLLVPNLTYGTRYAEPEKSSVYEAGAKGKWGGVSANLAVFKQEIEGFQSNIFTGTGFALSNAGKQSTFGVEFESQFQPIDPLALNFAVTWLDPKYDEFVYSAVGDLSGTKPAGIPEWSITLGGQYTAELGNGDRLIFNGSYHFESEVQIVDGLPGYLGLGADEAIAAAAQFTRQVDDVTASVTWAMDSGMEFSFWARNLLDDRYLLSIFDSVAQPYAVSGYPNQPRTFGFTGRVKW